MKAIVGDGYGDALLLKFLQAAKMDVGLAVNRLLDSPSLQHSSSNKSSGSNNSNYNITSSLPSSSSSFSTNSASSSLSEPMVKREEVEREEGEQKREETLWDILEGKEMGEPNLAPGPGRPLAEVCCFAVFSLFSLCYGLIN